MKRKLAWLAGGIVLTIAKGSYGAPVSESSGKAAKVTPLSSLAVRQYSGTEKRPVTLASGVKITEKQLMIGVDKKTLLVIVRNQSRRTLSGYTQVDIDAGKTSGGFFGKGPLFPAEQRIIKAKVTSPGWVRLVWVKANSWATSWRSNTAILGGTPLILTIQPNDKVMVSRSLRVVTGTQ